MPTATEQPPDGLLDRARQRIDRESTEDDPNSDQWSEERTMEMLRTADGRTLRVVAEVHDREGEVSREVEDHEQRIHHSYHGGPPGIGWDHTERLAT